MIARLAEGIGGAPVRDPGGTMDTARGLGTRAVSAAACGCIYGMVVSVMGCGTPDQAALDNAVVSATLADVHRWSLYEVRVAERTASPSHWFLFGSETLVPERLHAFLALRAGVV